jgi:hypothetical protein
MRSFLSTLAQVGLACISALLPQLANAQRIDTSKAQTEMHARVSVVVDQHASRLGLPRDVVSYCRTELNHHTETFPKNGSYPFGVNYNELKTQEDLDLVIALRESYEKTYMRLCLSRAKRDLDVK